MTNTALLFFLLKFSEQKVSSLSLPFHNPFTTLYHILKHPNTAQENQEDADRDKSAEKVDERTDIPTGIVAPVGKGIVDDIALKPPSHKERNEESANWHHVLRSNDIEEVESFEPKEFNSCPLPDDRQAEKAQNSRKGTA